MFFIPLFGEYLATQWLWWFTPSLSYVGQGEYSTDSLVLSNLNCRDYHGVSNNALYEHCKAAIYQVMYLHTKLQSRVCLWDGLFSPQYPSTADGPQAQLEICPMGREGGFCGSHWQS